jgi:hypothetical protein
MKKTLLLLLMLALNFVFIKPVSAEVYLSNYNIKPDLSNIYFLDSTTPEAAALVAPVAVQAEPIVAQAAASESAVPANGDLNLVVMNTANYEISAAEAKAGKKFRDFNDQFVFQIDSNSFSAPAALALKEYAVGLNSPLAAPAGFQFASRIYEFDLKTGPGAEFSAPFWFSVKYLEDDYFRKTMFFFDEQKRQWVGMESLIKNGLNKIVSKTNFTYAKVAILDDLNIMSAGTASWYKYKGCNCAASPDYPKGAQLKVTNIDNGKSVVVKVNDWGPDRSIHPDRVIDLDYVAFKQIASVRAGLVSVSVAPYSE